MNSHFVRSPPGADPIVVEAFFAAPLARVFRAWTDPEVVMKWFGPRPNSLHSARIDLRPGGAWQFLESSDHEKSVGFEGEYLEIEADQRLVFTWSKLSVSASGERDATPKSRVEVVFSADGKGTRVRLVHSSLHSEAVRKGFAGGWEKGFGHVNALLSTSQGVPPIGQKNRSTIEK